MHDLQDRQQTMKRDLQFLKTHLDWFNSLDDEGKMFPEDRAMVRQIEERTRVGIELGEEVERAERELEKVQGKMEIKVMKVEKDTKKFIRESELMEGNILALGMRKHEY
jgi:predicted unusual protein kinase regulating ubiquinone biosynthesis (AarF/ABC1/UbiB family)